MEKFKYYSLKQILSKNALYNLIIGERSNGKTTSVLMYALENFCKTGKQLAIIRRFDTEYTGKRGKAIFQGINEMGLVPKLTKGEWTRVEYSASMWYLARDDENGKTVMLKTPFAFGFALNLEQHDKMTAFPNVTTVLFDEFISRGTYLTNEFLSLTDILSTIIRLRTDVKIFMCGNTINKYCPYFAEMGLKHVRDMRQGAIDVYTYGDSGLTVAVEYCKHNEAGKASNVYFAFDNPKLKMITHGTWEVGIYPHCPYKYAPKDVAFEYFIQFDGDLLHAEVVEIPDKNVSFTFIHRKTTPIKNPDDDIIYTTDISPKENVFRNLNITTYKWQRYILSFFERDKVFYGDNEVGEIVRNYLLWCGGEDIDG